MILQTIKFMFVEYKNIFLNILHKMCRLNDYVGMQCNFDKKKIQKVHIKIMHMQGKITMNLKSNSSKIS